jgi:hypothetical protein
MVLQHFPRVEVGLAFDVLLGSDQQLLQLVLELECDGLKVLPPAGVHAELLHGLVELGQLVAFLPLLAKLTLHLLYHADYSHEVVNVQDFLPEPSSEGSQPTVQHGSPFLH